MTLSFLYRRFSTPEYPGRSSRLQITILLATYTFKIGIPYIGVPFAEVAAGLTEAEAEKLFYMVRAIQQKGITIIWVEHILMMMKKGVDRLLVINEGKRLMCGDPKECMESKEVHEVYLGNEEE
jgi:ABC-type uncharacterized transport system ATPase subunit